MVYVAPGSPSQPFGARLGHAGRDEPRDSAPDGARRIRSDHRRARDEDRGRRSTTGCLTRTAKLPRLSVRFCLRRSFLRSCSSPGARPERSSAAVGSATTHHFLIGFGLLSLAVAVPFLWRPLAWKRLLAYSSLEHMGVIALGIGFGSRLALAGVVIHVTGHALAKALGFYASIPLLRLQPRAISRPVRGLARLDNRVAGALAISLDLTERPPAVAALLQRAVRPARRLCRRLHDCGFARRRPACTRFPGSRSRA